MSTASLREGIQHVQIALRDPEEFAVRWHSGQAAYPWWVWASLFGTAILGTSTYGLTMGLLGGPDQMLRKALLCTFCAGVAWGLPLPALYILNSLNGSRLKASSTLLAAMVTTSWGGLAMVASIPINWFLTAAVPHPGFVLAVNLVVFAGVGISMTDTFARVMHRLEPERPTAPIWWIMLVALTGSELFYFVGLFQFGATVQ